MPAKAITMEMISETREKMVMLCRVPVWRREGVHCKPEACTPKLHPEGQAALHAESLSATLQELRAWDREPGPDTPSEICSSPISYPTSLFLPFGTQLFP